MRLRKAELPNDEWRPRAKRRPIARPYLIEWRFRARDHDTDRWGRWRKIKAYARKDVRDAALDGMVRKRLSDTVRYRAVDL